MESVWQDLRYAIAGLIKQPTFMLTAVFVLALGIGANTMMFSVVNEVVLRPLPYPDAGRLIAVWEDSSAQGFTKDTPAPANFMDWRAQNTVFDDIAAYNSVNMVLTGDEPEEILGHRVNAALFQILGVSPLTGRAILPEDDTPEAARVVVLSYSLWQRRFGRDPQIVGRTISLTGNEYTVIGVMPEHFDFPAPENQFWVPMAFTPAEAGRRASHYLHVVGRLKRSVTVDAARADMTAIAERLEAQFPETNTGVGAAVVPLHEDRVGDMQPAILVLSGAVGLVLLGACANVANLLLVRTTSRGREIAIRYALGAGRGRLIRQMMTESIVLALLGAGAGIVIAVGGVQVLNIVIPPRVLQGIPVTLDLTVLVFALVISVANGLMFGIVPAFQSLRAALSQKMNEGSRGSPARLTRTLRNALVVSELASALVLIVGAGLLFQTFARMLNVDFGFQADQVLTMRVAPPGSKYPNLQRRAQFYDSLLERIEASRDVQSASVISNLPLDFRGGALGITIEGDAPYAPNQTPIAVFRVVSPHYFNTMSIPLKAGRAFEAYDRNDTPGAVIVSEAAARKHWPGQSPLGKRLKIGPYQSTSAWLTVVGIAQDVHQFGIGDVRPQIYVPYTQFNGFAPQYLVIRLASGDPSRFAGTAREIIRDIDRDQPVMRVRSMEEIVAAGVADQRFNMLLLATFAALAMVLASIGLFGVLSYVVTQKKREIGLRLALGAQPSSVMALVFRQGAALIGIGVAAGLMLAVALTRLMSGLLFGVGTLDPATFAITTLALILAGLAATAIPAFRASRVDPIITLRAD